VHGCTSTGLKGNLTPLSLKNKKKLWLNDALANAGPQVSSDSESGPGLLALWPVPQQAVA